MRICRYRDEREPEELTARFGPPYLPRGAWEIAKGLKPRFRPSYPKLQKHQSSIKSRFAGVLVKVHCLECSRLPRVLMHQNGGFIFGQALDPKKFAIGFPVMAQPILSLA